MCLSNKFPILPSPAGTGTHFESHQALIFQRICMIPCASLSIHKAEMPGPNIDNS